MSVTEYPLAKHVMVEIDIKKGSQHDLLPKWGQYIHGDNLRYIIVDTPLPVILMFWDIRVVRPLLSLTRYPQMHLTSCTRYPCWHGIVVASTEAQESHDGYTTYVKMADKDGPM